MVITSESSGILADLVVNIHPDFKAGTKLGLKYYQLSNGDYDAVDRGAVGDVYDTKFITYGTEATISGIMVALNDNRTAYESILVMSGFASNEHIFGEDVNYETISGVVTDWGTFTQNSWKGFRLDLELRALSPAFSSSAVLPSFNSGCLQFGYKADRKWISNDYDTYYSDYDNKDHNNDAGILVGDFNFTNTELGNLRRWLATYRNTSFTLDLNNVNIFGPVEGAGSKTVKIINLTEKEPFGIDRRMVQITFVENST